MSPYEERRATYLDAAAAQEYTPGARQGGVLDLLPMEVFYLIPRLETGRGDFDDALVKAALDWIAARRDCADFALAGLLRLLERYPDHPLLTPARREAIADAALNFCYWYDQRDADGRGIRGMCFHTENHQIVFHACELLAGQRWADRAFPGTGRTGAWHAEHAAARIREWIDLRARFGFAEWLSYYYDEDLLGLLNIYDFTADPDLRRRAGMLTDLLLFETALHGHHGVLGGSHGRTYAEFVSGGRQDPTTSIAWLAFGTGTFDGKATLALTSMATSDYRCPALIEAVAHDVPEPDILCRERHGLNVADAAGYGPDPARLEDAPFFWACQTARHPLARPTALRLAGIADDPWLTRFVEAADERLDATKALIEEAGGAFDGDAVNTALSEVNLVTYRTPDYLLGCAQDFRPGRPGYQQHVWQATLTPEATVFTTHPGSEGADADHIARPNFWAGNRYLPRAAQHKNVLVCLHHVPAEDPLPFSHAYFPGHAFDELTQRGNWTFGRAGDAYVALYSQHGAAWAQSGPWASTELRAPARSNVWVCEMGSRAQSGTFEEFCDNIAAAAIRCDGLKVTYESPSQDEVRFAWTGPLKVGGKTISRHGYPRFDTPYCKTDLGERVYTLTRGDNTLTWDFR